MHRSALIVVTVVFAGCIVYGERPADSSPPPSPPAPVAESAPAAPAETPAGAVSPAPPSATAATPSSPPRLKPPPQR
jgi:hypothetical protein